MIPPIISGAEVRALADEAMAANPVPMPITMTLAREVRSGNVLAYGHWRKRIADREAWTFHIKSAVRTIEMATGSTAWWTQLPCRVYITSYRHGVLDDDNLSAGCKHLRDALVRCKLLKDDTKEWATFTYAQVKVPRATKSYTIVTITDSGADGGDVGAGK